MMVKPVQAPAGETVVIKSVEAILGSLTPAEIKKELAARKKWRATVNKDIDAANAELSKREQALTDEAAAIRAEAKMEAEKTRRKAAADAATIRVTLEDEKAAFDAEKKAERDTLRTRTTTVKAREDAVTEQEETARRVDEELDRREAAAAQKMRDAQAIMDAAESRRKRILAAAG